MADQENTTGCACWKPVGSPSAIPMQYRLTTSAVFEHIHHTPHSHPADPNGWRLSMRSALFDLDANRYHNGGRGKYPSTRLVPVGSRADLSRQLLKGRVMRRTFIALAAAATIGVPTLYSGGAQAEPATTGTINGDGHTQACLLYTSPSPRD